MSGCVYQQKETQMNFVNAQTTKDLNPSIDAFLGRCPETLSVAYSSDTGSEMNDECTTYWEAVYIEGFAVTAEGVTISHKFKCPIMLCMNEKDDMIFGDYWETKEDNTLTVKERIYAALGNINHALLETDFAGC